MHVCKIYDFRTRREMYSIATQKRKKKAPEKKSKVAHLLING